ncbi:hypothetical protein J6590_025383 [Homalodisca vitripennis]|nr:hypothetical protein J6590_025383 [Homalodisca vitripennis]
MSALPGNYVGAKFRYAANATVQGRPREDELKVLRYGTPRPSAVASARTINITGRFRPLTAGALTGLGEAKLQSHENCDIFIAQFLLAISV